MREKDEVGLTASGWRACLFRLKRKASLKTASDQIRSAATDVAAAASLFDFLKNGAFVAITAHGLIGISLIWDKVLLKSPGTKNLFSYVFWLGAISVFGVILVPGWIQLSFFSRHLDCVSRGRDSPDWRVLLLHGP